LRTELHGSEIIVGYKRAYAYLEKALPELVCETVTEPKNLEEIVRICKSVLATKQHDYEGFFAPLAAEACLDVMNRGGKTSVVNVDSVELLRSWEETLGSRKSSTSCVSLEELKAPFSMPKPLRSVSSRTELRLAQLRLRQPS
jgi:hypothetical protein